MQKKLMHIDFQSVFCEFCSIGFAICGFRLRATNVLFSTCSDECVAGGTYSIEDTEQIGEGMYPEEGVYVQILCCRPAIDRTPSLARC